MIPTPDRVLYLRLLELARDLELPPRTFLLVDALHDPDCRRPEGGPCSCTPDLEIVGEGEN